MLRAGLSEVRGALGGVVGGPEVKPLWAESSLTPHQASWPGAWILMLSHPHPCARLGNVQKLWTTGKVQEAGSGLGAPSEREMGPRLLLSGTRRAGSPGSRPLVAGPGKHQNHCQGFFHLRAVRLTPACSDIGWSRDRTGHSGEKILASKSDAHSLSGWELWPEGLTGVTGSLGEPRSAHRCPEPSTPEEHGAEQTAWGEPLTHLLSNHLTLARCLTLGSLCLPKKKQIIEASYLKCDDAHEALST